MSSTRDNVSLYNNSQDNMLSYTQNTSYSHIGADNQTTSLDFIDIFTSDREKEDVINQNFKWLELQLLKNHRQISSLDFYQIEGSFGGENVSTADLLKNHSLFCSSSATVNNLNFVAGDLLHKTNTGEIEKVSLGLHNGIYMPSWTIEKDSMGRNNKLFLEWNYNDNISSDAPPSIPKLTLTNIKGQYGEWYSQDTGWKELSFSGYQNVPPVIKGYNAKGEEVFWDIGLKYFNNKYHITGIPSYIETIVVK